MSSPLLLMARKCHDSGILKLRLTGRETLFLTLRTHFLLQREDLWQKWEHLNLLISLSSTCPLRGNFSLQSYTHTHEHTLKLTLAHSLTCIHTTSYKNLSAHKYTDLLYVWKALLKVQHTVLSLTLSLSHYLSHLADL